MQRVFDQFWRFPYVVRAASLVLGTIAAMVVLAVLLDESLSVWDAVVYGTVFPLFVAKKTEHTNPRPSSRPADVSRRDYWRLKISRWLLCAVIAAVFALLTDDVFEGDGSLGTLDHIGWSLMLTWLFAGSMPFWQPNREKVEKESLPPFPPKLRFPPRPDLPA